MSATTQPQTTFVRHDSSPVSPVPASQPDALQRSEHRPAQPAFMARRRHDLLARTVTEEIVPRLVLAPRSGCVEAVPTESFEGDVAELTALVLQPQFDIGGAPLKRLSGHQSGQDGIYLDLLAPVARRLGKLWEEDLCDFVQVTVGLLRLHQVLTTLSVPLGPESGPVARNPRVLLTAVPGDQHSFGLSMVASFFQRAGWNGWSGVPGTAAELYGRVQAEWFSVVGFSVSSERQLEALTAAIRGVRRTSRNREVGIMVGGPVFIAQPELVAYVGADTTASDGRQAVLQAQRLATLIPSRG